MKIMSQKEHDEFVKKMAESIMNSSPITMKAGTLSGSVLGSGSITAMASPSTTASNTWYGSMGLPDDAEREDLIRLASKTDEFFDQLYPEFEPKVIHTFDKDYFLPALKVLIWNGKEFDSPSRPGTWKNMELKARCIGGGSYEYPYGSEAGHEAPEQGCDCGVYGSVNLEEVREFMGSEYYMNTNVYFIGRTSQAPTTLSELIQSGERPPTRLLCIVEPMPNAKVVLCRKGWKASHAFISEIVGETIPIHHASDLLSMAWGRKIDVGRLYENR